MFPVRFLATLFVGAACAAVALDVRKERDKKVRRTARWLDEFVDHFVVGPSADAPDFATQSMPKLESLAYLYNEGLVNREPINRRLFGGDLSQYELELEFFLLEREETFGREEFQELRKMLEANKRFGRAGIQAEMAELKRVKAERQVEAAEAPAPDLVAEAEALRGADWTKSEQGEAVPFRPNEKLYEEFGELFGNKNDEPEQDKR